MALVRCCRSALIASLLLAMSVGVRADDKESSSDLGAQAAADALKAFAGADGAFIAAGMLKDGYEKSLDLDSMLLYPEDEMMVVKLTGAQVREALERSVSLYPQPNTSFLQLSGFEATFNKNAADGHRLTSITAGGAPVNNTASYLVAMPSRLAQGGYGYFKIWDKPDIVKSLGPSTVESVLKGKKYTDSSPRWTVIAIPVAQHSSSVVSGGKTGNGH